MAMSHAPGLLGTPVSGQHSSALSNASWARSSARLRSRTMRTRPPSSRADSIRQTASIVRLVGVCSIAPAAGGSTSSAFGSESLAPRGSRLADHLEVLGRDIGGLRQLVDRQYIGRVQA